MTGETEPGSERRGPASQTFLQRAQLLCQQSRFDLAESELGRALAEDPENPDAHALLALCLAQREAFPRALGAARMAIRLAPDYAVGHYVLATVLCDANRLNAALDALREALRLDPSNPDYYALQAGIRLDQEQWRTALLAAERGLALDPSHVKCLNFRAMALKELGENRKSAEAMRDALAEDPEEAFTHANRGWALLDDGKTADAMEHFREALRIEPTLEWARKGILEALKSRNRLYRAALRALDWIADERRESHTLVTIGLGFTLYVASRHVDDPDIAQWLRLPAILAGVVLALLLGAHPLFNLLLLADRFGRLVLSREEIRGSVAAVGCLLAGAGLMILGMMREQTGMLLGALAFALAGPFAMMAHLQVKMPDRQDPALIATLLLIAGYALPLLALAFPSLGLREYLWTFGGSALAIQLALGWGKKNPPPPPRSRHGRRRKGKERRAPQA